MPNQAEIGALQLGEAANEADWRALVERGLKGAPWARLVGKTADGIAIEPLYREPDAATGSDISGAPGAAPFVRGAGAGGWLIRQPFAAAAPDRANRDILADLAGGVGGIELVIDPNGARGVAIKSASDLDHVLADVILEAAPVSLDASGVAAAALLEAKLKGVAAPGTAFNLDPIGALMRDGVLGDVKEAAAFAARVRHVLPAATALRADARPVHEAGASEAQEVATALSSGIFYLRALQDAGLSIDESAKALEFAVSMGPDVLIETAKLRALRLCWARVMEASGAKPEARYARIHAFTSQRMLTRYDSYTNILRITTAAFAAAVGGANVITTSAFTDALGAPTPFARRIARNTQNVLAEECKLGHVADPAGGSWFVENMTRALAAKAWEIMQAIEAKGGIVAAYEAGYVQEIVSATRAVREKQINTRREAITGVTDFPLLDAGAPEVETRAAIATAPNALAPIRWAAAFETLRDKAEAKSPRPAAFFATLGSLSEFSGRAQYARNLLAVGGVGAIGEEAAYPSRDAMVDAFRASKARVAVICGTDAAYGEDGENAAQRLKAAGAPWVALAGKPGELETKLRGAGVDQFVFIGIDALKELETLHAAFGIA